MPLNRFSILFFLTVYFAHSHAQIPTITGFSPVSAKVGKTVTITGTNFHATADSNVVYFGTVAAEIINASATQLVVKVPSGAPFDAIKIYTRGYTVKSNLDFIPTFDGAAINSGSFGPNIDFTVNNSTFSKLLIADFNNDKKPDILKYPGVLPGREDFSVFINQADSGAFNDTSLLTEATAYRFAFSENLDTTVLDVIIHDFDHDSLPDIIALMKLQDSFYGRKVWVDFIKNTTTAGNISFSLFHKMQIRENNGGITNCGGPLIFFEPDLTRGVLKATDFNYDGVTDYAVSLNWENYGCSNDFQKYNVEMYSLTGIYNSNGDLQFQKDTIQDVSANTRFLIFDTGELNGDNKPDLIRSWFAGSTMQNSTYLSTNMNSQGTSVEIWAEAFLNSQGLSGINEDINLIDADKDGKLDIFRTHYGHLYRNIHSSGNLSSFSFSSQILLGINNGDFNAEWSDMNGDGKPDVVSLMPSSNMITVTQNNSQPGVLNSSVFTTYQFPILGSTPQMVKIYDLDQDGKPEIISGNTGSKLSVLRNLITAEFVLDTLVCAGENDTITFTGTAGSSAVYAWDFGGAQILSGSNNGPYIVKWNTPGIKTITLSVTENSITNNYSTTVHVLPVPTSSFTTPPYMYINESNTITYTGTGNAGAAYHWNFDSGNILSGSGQGPYEVMWTLAGNRQLSLYVIENGCVSDTTIITKMINSIYQEERICVVTVDPVSGKNLVVWEKAVGPDIASYLIYKEISTNFYSAIGMVPYNDMSTYLDAGSNPGAYPARYKLSILDSQGNESQKSPYHKTIHLQASQGVPSSTINLSWTNYSDEEGTFVPAMYYIYRGSQPDNLILLDSVSGSITTYSDLNVFSVYYYMIGVLRQGGCNPTAKSQFDGSFSNIKDISGLVGMDESLNIGTILISPNPMSSSATLTIPNSKFELRNSNFDLRISDLTGKVVRVESPLSILRLAQDDKGVVIERGNLKPGVYFVELKADRVYRGKLVVE